MNDEYALLRQLVFNIHPITNGWDAFSAIWHPYSADRRQVITQSGTTEKWLYFVLEGVQRVYYFDDQGREATLVFFLFSLIWRRAGFFFSCKSLRLIILKP